MVLSAQILKKAEDGSCEDADHDVTNYVITEKFVYDSSLIYNLKDYDAHIILQYITRQYAPSSINVILPPL